MDPLSDEEIEVTRPWVFGMVMAHTLFDERLSATARLVYTGLCVHAGASRRAWPATRTLAAELGIARSSVMLGLKQLEHAGWITRKRRTTADGYNRSTIIVLRDAPRAPKLSTVGQLFTDPVAREPDHRGGPGAGPPDDQRWTGSRTGWTDSRAIGVDREPDTEQIPHEQTPRARASDPAEGLRLVREAIAEPRIGQP